MGTGSNCNFIKTIKVNLDQLHNFFYFWAFFLFSSQLHKTLHKVIMLHKLLSWIRIRFKKPVGFGFATLRKTAGSGSAKNGFGSTALCTFTVQYSHYCIGLMFFWEKWKLCLSKWGVYLLLPYRQQYYPVNHAVTQNTVVGSMTDSKPWK